jgi:hypothetical protein
VDRGDDVGLREVQQIGVTLDVLGVIGEPVTPELLFGEAPALQQHTPGAVQHDDALVEQLAQSGGSIHGSTLAAVRRVRPAKTPAVGTRKAGQGRLAQ